MKTKKVFYFSLISVILFSCAMPTSYYQVYRAVPSDDVRLENNTLVYEDDNCIVSYNFWGAGGNVGFRIFNKTSENIVLKLDESFFVYNGQAYDYYKNRVFSHSTSAGRVSGRSAAVSSSETGTNIWGLAQTNRTAAGASVGEVNTSEFSVSFQEASAIVIPPNTARFIAEYKINETLFRDCDLFKYPGRNQINTKSYSRSNSPIVFSNRISYTIGENETTIRFENEFYISEITNYPEREIRDFQYTEFCDQKSTTRSKVFKNVSPDKFYIEYKKGNDTWKH